MCRSLAQFPSLLGQRLPQPFGAGESQKSLVRAEAGSIRALVADKFTYKQCEAW